MPDAKSKTPRTDALVDKLTENDDERDLGDGWSEEDAIAFLRLARSLEEENERLAEALRRLLIDEEASAALAQREKERG